jgi:hypothetical protein
VNDPEPTWAALKSRSAASSCPIEAVLSYCEVSTGGIGQ